MVGIVVGVPLIIMRATRRRQFAAAILVLALVVPSMAGEEIRNEFFSASDYQEDGSANQPVRELDRGDQDGQRSSDPGRWACATRACSRIQYGADIEGRVIHSQFFQILADCGYPGLFLYLMVLATAWLSLRQVTQGDEGTRRTTRRC